MRMVVEDLREVGAAIRHAVSCRTSLPRPRRPRVRSSRETVAYQCPIMGCARMRRAVVQSGYSAPRSASCKRRSPRTSRRCHPPPDRGHLVAAVLRPHRSGSEGSQFLSPMTPTRFSD